MQLNGFGFSGYRSVGDELVKIWPLSKVNLIIGQNNVGKSNIINFISSQYGYLVKSMGRARSYGGKKEESPFKDIDRHVSSERFFHRISFPLSNEELLEYINKKLPQDQQEPYREIAKKLLLSKPFFDGDATWFTYKSSSPSGGFELELKENDVYDVLDGNEWRRLWSALTRQTGGDLRRNWIPETLASLSFVPDVLPNVEVVPAIRKVGGAGSEALDFSGEGIIERLAKIQNPPLSDQQLKEKFNAINGFIREVLESSDAEIEIPYERNMILVHMDGRTLPLDSLGTGVHEVVILAAAATLLEDTILCVEEPELHLHPLLQRKLLKYLAEKTSNQYFFTTHSAHLLDAVEAEIFHVTHNNGVSSVEAISSTKQRSNICNDLGYKASDILQANSIVWVEGPSDRIYLNYWIKSVSPELVEGVHYSIMFYGGRLFSHLTALDQDAQKEAVEDMISVRKLNRNTVIMFDSDKDASRARINPTKQRLKQEFDFGPGFAWVTKGREVENYLNPDWVEASVLAVHPSARRLKCKGDWENLLIYEEVRKGEERTANKVKVARHYVNNYSPDFSVLDLKARVGELVNFIRESNGL